VAYNIRGPLAEEVQRTAGVKLTHALLAATFWVDFTKAQWDSKSPWHDRRVRLATALAIDRSAINQAETLGFSRPSSSIIPNGFDFAWSAPPIAHDLAQAKRLLREAGYPNGFDAGDYVCEIPFAGVGEAVVSYLGAVGIRARMRTLERAALATYARQKTATHLLQMQSAAFGDAVTRIERHMVSGGDLAFGSYAEIDDLFKQQAREPVRARREALLHAIQRIAYERVMFAPIWQVAQLNGVRASVEQPAIGLIDFLPYSAPYEDVKLTH
jgi:peptide/nickel transport system substrate-binding protein